MVVGPAAQRRRDRRGHRAAYDAGELVRTHVLRPTWHTVDPADLRWLLELTGPRVRGLLTPMFRRMGVSVAAVDRAQTVIAAEMDTGPRTRLELGHALTAAGVDVRNGIVLSNLIMQAETELVVCSGPLRGRHPTYVPFDTRCAQAADPTAPADPAAELLRRCVGGRGPISLRDVARWSGLTLTQVRQGDRVADDLDTVEVDGVELAHDPDATQRALAEPTAQDLVRVLPEFDELTLSCRDVGWPWWGDAPSSVPTTMINRNPGLIMVGDRLAGYWARSLTARQLSITTWLTAPFRAEETLAVWVEMAQLYDVELVTEQV